MPFAAISGNMTIKALFAPRIQALVLANYQHLQTKRAEVSPGSSAVDPALWRLELRPGMVVSNCLHFVSGVCDLSVAIWWESEFTSEGEK